MKHWIWLASLSFIISSITANANPRVENAQQAANYSDAVVLKVKTLELNSQVTEGALQVVKVLKGAFAGSSLNVYAEGDYCHHGQIMDPSAGEWIVIVRKDDDGDYVLKECADNELQIDTQGKIRIQLDNKELALSESEFLDFINLRTIPTLKGLVCRAWIYRNFSSDGYEETQPLPNIYISIDEVPTDPQNPMVIDYRHTFDGLAIDYRGYAELTPSKDRQTEYLFSGFLREPFFGVETSWDIKWDITRFHTTLETSVQAFRNVKGEPIDVGLNSHYSYKTNFDCNWRLGAPLVPSIN